MSHHLVHDQYNFQKVCFNLTCFSSLGHMYWVYRGTKLQPRSPRHVRALGLQNDRIGAAVWWHRNGKSYFFKGEKFLLGKKGKLH